MKKSHTTLLKRFCNLQTALNGNKFSNGNTLVATSQHFTLGKNALNQKLNKSSFYHSLVMKKTTHSTSLFTQKRCYADSVVKVPSMGDSITEGTIQEWRKKEGEAVEEDEVICRIETDKVVVDVVSPGKGAMKKILSQVGETVSLDQNICVIDIGAESTVSSSNKEESKKSTKEPEKQATKESAKEEKSEKQKQEKKQEPKQKPQTQATVVPGSRNETRVPMSRMRKTIANRLKESQNTYAMLTTFNEVDMNNLTNLRNKYKDEFFEKHGVKLGFMSAFVKASAIALSEQPVVNAVIEGDDIVYRDYIDISVAVASPNGLLVPVMRNCENKSFADIEKEIAMLGKKAKNSQISLPEMQGGTFTISNGGVFGSLMGTPIINPPQSSILGMHGINKRPVVVNDQIVIRPMMYVALTYDHRIIDGREAVLFLRRIKELIEEPEKFLLM